MGARFYVRTRPPSHGRGGTRSSGVFALELRRLEWKVDLEDRSFARSRHDLDPASVALDDAVGQGQAEAGALADFLRREEGVEDPLEMLL